MSNIFETWGLPRRFLDKNKAVTIDSVAAQEMQAIAAMVADLPMRAINLPWSGSIHSILPANPNKMYLIRGYMNSIEHGSADANAGQWQIKFQRDEGDYAWVYNRYGAASVAYEYFDVATGLMVIVPVGHAVYGTNTAACVCSQTGTLFYNELEVL